MDIFGILQLIGGVSLFLFGMSLMGTALERRAGEGLTNLLSRLTTGKAAGFFTGLLVTAVIQSSSATTVMVVGFVNSGLLTLRQAIHVIMGANVGTTVTSWLLGLAGIESGNFLVRLLKPSSFTPVLALVGIVLYMGRREEKRKYTGEILLGFAVLMAGMDIMSTAVTPLKEDEGFHQILTWFQNPLLGVLAGAVLTAVIQSSSASVGILQALASTGQVTVGTAMPIILGQNIGTCVTALLAAIGTSVHARRAAVVHLLFNLAGTAAALAVLALVLPFTGYGSFSEGRIDGVGIALAHTIFNVASTALLLPCAPLLERIVCRLVPEGHGRMES